MPDGPRPTTVLRNGNIWKKRPRSSSTASFLTSRATLFSDQFQMPYPANRRKLKRSRPIKAILQSDLSSLLVKIENLQMALIAMTTHTANPLINRHALLTSRSRYVTAAA